MKWLQHNWFKIGILILITVTLLGGYQYMNTRQENILRADCQELGLERQKDVDEGYSGLLVYSFEYNYSPEYKACIVAYRGTDFDGLLSKMSGPFIFVVQNLSTGEMLLETRVPAGDTYANTVRTFDGLRAKYIGSIKTTEEAES